MDICNYWAIIIIWLTGYETVELTLGFSVKWDCDLKPAESRPPITDRLNEQQVKRKEWTQFSGSQ